MLELQKIGYRIYMLEHVLYFISFFFNSFFFLLHLCLFVCLNLPRISRIGIVMHSVFNLCCLIGQNSEFMEARVCTLPCIFTGLEKRGLCGAELSAGVKAH